MHKKFGSHNGFLTQSMHLSENTKSKRSLRRNKERVLLANPSLQARVKGIKGNHQLNHDGPGMSDLQRHLHPNATSTKDVVKIHVLVLCTCTKLYVFIEKADVIITHLDVRQTSTNFSVNWNTIFRINSAISYMYY